MLFQLQPGMRFNPVGCEFSIHESTIAMWWRVFKQKRTENMAVQRLGPHPWPLPGRGLSVLSSGRVGSGLTVWLPRAAGVRDSPGRRSGSWDQAARTDRAGLHRRALPASRVTVPWTEGVCRAQRSSVGEASPLRMTQNPPGRSIHLFPSSQLSLSLSAAFSPAAFPQSCCISFLPLNFSLIASFWICCRIRRVWGAAAGPLGSEDRGGWPPEAARRGDMEASEPGARCREPLVWTASTACGCMQRWGDCSRRRG